MKNWGKKRGVISPRRGTKGFEEPSGDGEARGKQAARARAL